MQPVVHNLNATLLVKGADTYLPLLESQIYAYLHLYLVTY